MAERRIVIQELASPLDLAPPSPAEPYVAIIWDCDGSFNVDQRYDLGRALILSGCRYAVCGGVGCSDWDNDVDLAWVMLDIEAKPAGLSHVTTSWHTDEPVEQVLWFALNCTDFDRYTFRDFRILVIGQDPSQRRNVRLRLNAQP